MPTDRAYAFAKTRNVGYRKPKLGKETQCENDTQPAATLAAPVSPAVSQAISLNSGREQPTTETPSNQPCSQSGSKAQKPNCYQCKHRRQLIGDAHSSCVAMGSAGVIAGLVFMSGNSEFMAGDIHVKASTHGVRSGWFNWPLNFDPAWLEKCSMYDAVVDTVVARMR